MEIPQELMEKWNKLTAYGDPGKIVASMPEGSKVTEQAIRNALKEGSCSDAIFKAIAEFYKQRAETIAQYL